jgi:hypothetical protein
MGACYSNPIVFSKVVVIRLDSLMEDVRIAALKDHPEMANWFSTAYRKELQSTRFRFGFVRKICVSASLKDWRPSTTHRKGTPSWLPEEAVHPSRPPFAFSLQRCLCQNCF